MSPRPKKPRICAGRSRCGEGTVFKPAGIPLLNISRVDLFADEWESVRLCDHQGLTQQQTGDRMGVSRSTVQRLVSAGRKKIAEAISRPAALVIRPNTEAESSG